MQTSVVKSVITVFAVAFAAIALASSCHYAHAQTAKPKATLQSEVTSQLPNNTTGQITPSVMRSVLGDMIASDQQYPGVNYQVAGSYTVAASDYGAIIKFTTQTTSSLSLPTGTLANGFYPFGLWVINGNSGTMTITPVSGLINGSATYSLAAGSGLMLHADGTNWLAMAIGGSGTGTVTSAATAGGNGISTSGTCTITTSGTCTVAVSLSELTNALSSNVALGPGPGFFTGPSVAQGGTGTWFASGQVTLGTTNSTGETVTCKLWDGTTVIAATFQTWTIGFNDEVTLALSGYLASPAGNINIACQGLEGTATTMRFNDSGTGKDSVLSVFRIN
jgi:hypothetical protein